MANQNIRICSVKDIPKGEGKAFKVGSLDLAIFRTEDGYFASSDICSHEEEHLHDGWLEGHCIECPRHGSQFDLKTGEALSLPAIDPIEVYELKLEGDDIFVTIPEKYLASVEARKDA
ncbi:MAG TPA: non-heme iron oxygenase ferredoxin subunit [bacterium]|jgi:nitrite reductase/ring-hydroxylating ferredoxin subunit